MSKFEKELHELMKKYGVEIVESENYDYEESYVGSTFYFSGKGIFVSVKEVKDNQ